MCGGARRLFDMMLCRELCARGLERNAMSCAAAVQTLPPLALSWAQPFCSVPAANTVLVLVATGGVCGRALRSSSHSLPARGHLHHDALAALHEQRRDEHEEDVIEEESAQQDGADL